MSTPLREAALAAIEARLRAVLPDVTTERARRAAVDTTNETLPRLILRGDSWTADLSQEPGVTHYACAFSVTGYSAARSDLAAEQALTTLHARVVAALSGWTPATAGLGDVVEQDSEFTLYDAEESQQPAGEFLARFEMLAIAPTGAPYA
jgi:hypothetical protein